mmetsp:Transcript_95306/g.308739  ORF Transcript_95306/g.308739 Transcript_95306/m.308739 type:complete len:307 (+) Transcript_95306:280-1200(+)
MPGSSTRTRRVAFAAPPLPATRCNANTADPSSIEAALVMVSRGSVGQAQVPHVSPEFASTTSTRPAGRNKSKLPDSRASNATTSSATPSAVGQSGFQPRAGGSNPVCWMTRSASRVKSSPLKFVAIRRMSLPPSERSGSPESPAHSTTETAPWLRTSTRGRQAPAAAEAAVQSTARSRIVPVTLHSTGLADAAPEADTSRLKTRKSLATKHVFEAPHATLWGRNRGLGQTTTSSAAIAGNAVYATRSVSANCRFGSAPSSANHELSLCNFRGIAITIPLSPSPLKAWTKAQMMVAHQAMITMPFPM